MTLSTLSILLFTILGLAQGPETGSKVDLGQEFQIKAGCD